MLLSRGARIVAGVGLLDNPLQAAAARGHAEIITLLLDSGAALSTKSSTFGTALQAAACYGRIPAIEVLSQAFQDFDKGLFDSDVLDNSRNDHSIYVGAIDENEYTKTFQVLLQRGADIHCQGGKYGFALQAAAYVGDEGAVKTLVDHGAVVNASGGHFGSSLQAAACGDAQKLWDWWFLAKRSNEGESSLPDTSTRSEQTRHAKLLTLLLRAGADANERGNGFFGSPLQAAAYSGGPSLVSILLDHEVQVQRPDV